MNEMPCGLIMFGLATMALPLASLALFVAAMALLVTAMVLLVAAIACSMGSLAPVAHFTGAATFAQIKGAAIALLASKASFPSDSLLLSSLQLLCCCCNFT